MDETPTVLRIASMLDRHLAEHLDDVSVIVVQKVSRAFLELVRRQLTRQTRSTLSRFTLARRLSSENGFCPAVASPTLTGPTRPSLPPVNHIIFSARTAATASHHRQRLHPSSSSQARRLARLSTIRPRARLRPLLQITMTMTTRMMMRTMTTTMKFAVLTRL